MPNVYFLDRHICYWGGFGHVRVSIKGINELFRKKIPFDYAVLLTGQDYPIKTNEQILEFFQRNNGKSFMDYFPLPTDQWLNGGLERIERWHVRLFDRHYLFPRKADSFIKRRFPKGFQPFGGSSYWCLTRDCIEYLYSTIHTNTEFVKFFRYVDVPDEIFFQTILLNSSLAPDIVNDDMRYIEWKDPNSGSPSVLNMTDFPRLENSPKLFARKFDEEVDVEVLDRIDREVLGVTNQVLMK
jgi:hypothetical protein